MTEILPLLVFTVCSGLAAGACVVNAFFPNKEQKRAWLFPLVCIVLLGIGLIGTLAHLGQPMRFIYGFSNPTAMISQEAYWSCGFGIVLLIAAILGKVKKSVPVALNILAAIAGAGLMIVTSLAYFLSFNYESWCNPATFVLFIAGDLALGAALCMLFHNKELLGKIGCIITTVVQAVLGVGCLLFLPFMLDATMVMTIIAVIVGPVACIVMGVLGLKKGTLDRNLVIAILACAIVSAILMRYAFYASGMFV